MKYPPGKHHIFGLFILIILLAPQVRAQFIEPVDSVKSKLKFLYMEVGYGLVDFYANTYQAGKVDDRINYKYGVVGGLGYTLTPLTIALNYCYGLTSFQNDPYWNSEPLYFHAINASLKLNVFPYSTWIIPEVGLGYSHTLLNSPNVDIGNSFFNGVQLQSAHWLAGIRIKLFSRAFLSVQYTQSIPMYAQPLDFSFTEKLTTIDNENNTRLISICLQVRLLNQ